MRVVLIANPKAGRKRGVVAALQARAVFLAAGWDAETRLTTGPKDAVRIAREAAEEGFDAVFACGGDGTLSEAMTGLLDTNVPAGIIPAGTGNDFARTIGLSLDPAQAAAQLVGGQAASMDMLEVNGGGLWAINVVGAGFDCRVCERINRRSRVAGGLPAYLLATAQELIAYRPTELKLRVDGDAWEGQALLVAICNSRSYGAGMKIAPHAEIDDGLLDVVVVGYMPRMAFIRHFPSVFRGAHLGHPAVQVWRGREVDAVTAEPSWVNVDGDLQAQTPLSVKVAPGKGKLWLPA